MYLRDWRMAIVVTAIRYLYCITVHLQSRIPDAWNNYARIYLILRFRALYKCHVLGREKSARLFRENPGNCISLSSRDGWVKRVTGFTYVSNFRWRNAKRQWIRATFVMSLIAFTWLESSSATSRRMSLNRRISAKFPRDRDIFYFWNLAVFSEWTRGRHLPIKIL